MGKMAFTIPEAVKEGAGSRTVIYEKIKSGALKARKRGRSTIILADDLKQYLESLPDYLEQAAACVMAAPQTKAPTVAAPPSGPDSFSRRHSAMKAERDEYMRKTPLNQA